MPPTGEPDAGRGGTYPKNVILGTNQLQFGIGDLTQAVKDNTQAVRSESALNPAASSVHQARFAGNPEAQKQWNDRLNARAAYNQRAQTKRDRDAQSQTDWHNASRQSMRDQLAASAAANSAPPDLSFPKNNGGYTGGVDAGYAPPGRRQPGQGNTSAPPWVATQPPSQYTYSNYGIPSGFSVPWQASQSAPNVGWAGAANGGTQTPRPPTMTPVGGMGTPTPGGGGGGGAAGGTGGRPGGGASPFGNTKSFLSENKGMIGVGLAAGAVNALGGVIQNYSTRMLNTNYDQFGNLVVLRNGGYSGMTYGDASSQGIDKLRSSRFIATSPADLINGGSQILANSNNQTFGQNLSNAGTSAYLTPGMGLGQAAANMQQEGTNRANVMAQMMFGTGTRLPGGGQLSETGLANAALNATRGGQGMNGLTPDKLAAMLQQGGTLRTNLNTYAQNAGLGPEAVDSLANILTAQTAYQRKYGNTNDFQSIVQAASQGDKSAQAKLKGTGIGESVQQSIQNTQGTQINRDMNSQATYIDTLKTTNQWLQRLNDSITNLMKSTGLDKALGVVGGANAGSGGRVSGAMKYGASGAMLGMMAGPEGALIGGALGSAYGFVFGGASKNVTPSAKTGQSATPAPASGAANIAVSFAEAQVGKEYIMGATGPNAYDCSGLMQAAFKQAGVSIPRVSSQQAQFGTAVPLNQIAPGDLIFPKGYDGLNGAPAGLPGHVMMALGPGPNVPVVEAGSPSLGIFNSNISVGQIELARRMTNGVGTLSPNLNNTAGGGSTTNTSTSAGTSQQTGAGGAGAGTGASGAGSSNGAATGASGMNEVDVLGSVLGRAAFQTPGTVGNSLQQGFLTTVNGTAGGSYSKGAYSIDGDQYAMLHDDEMVLDKKSAASVRAALMADIPNHSSPGKASITFASGAINITVNGTMTNSAASNAAKQVADAIASDSRIQQIGAGL